MPQTMVTCKTSETPDVLERLARRWSGALFEVAVRPQSNGQTVVTVTTPSGVEEPPDPGMSPLESELVDLRARFALSEDRARSMAAARDASDAEAQALREEISDARAVEADLRAQLAEAASTTEHEQ